MRIKIFLKTTLDKDFAPVEIEKGITSEELVQQYQEKLPYRILAVMINNKIFQLHAHPREGEYIEFLDMREPAVNHIYQHSLSLIYLKAIEDVLGNVRVVIENSLNKGLFTKIRTQQPITEEQVAAVEKRMHELVEADLPIEKEVIPRDEAIKDLMEDGRRERVRLLQADPKLKKVKFYSLGGYRNFFYGLMVPSTGYVEHFELRKYRDGVLLRFPHPSDPSKIPEYVDDFKLYDAFGETNKWGRLMGVRYASDLNEKVEDGSYRELIQLSEALHEKKIAEIADMIKESGRRIILIAGPSSSGKTTFAKRLCIQLKVVGLNPLYLGTDDYFKERDETPRDENGEYDFENLGAMDIALFNRDMNGLLAGKSVDLPSFDFVEGKKTFGKRILSIKPTQPVVIEGIHALNEAMTPDIPHEQKFKIYISPLTQLNIDDHNRIPTTDERMLRRMVRDFQFRGRSAQTTIRDWPKVRAGEDKNIFPFNGEADVFFNSVHIYELAVLKKYAEPLLEAITHEEPEYSEAVRMLRYLRFFKTIEDDSIIVNNSIIREFIGGSIFV